MREFYDAVGDDLNIPRALGVLWNMVRGEQKSAAVYNAALEMDKVFGLDLHREPEKQPEDDFTPEERAEIEAMIAARTAAKKAKNYAEADRIRAELCVARHRAHRHKRGHDLRPGIKPALPAK